MFTYLSSVPVALCCCPLGNDKSGSASTAAASWPVKVCPYAVMVRLMSLCLMCDWAVCLKGQRFLSRHRESDIIRRAESIVSNKFSAVDQSGWRHVLEASDFYPDLSRQAKESRLGEAKGRLHPSPLTLHPSAAPREGRPSLPHTDRLKSHRIVFEKILRPPQKKLFLSIFVLTHSGATITMTSPCVNHNTQGTVSRLRMWGGCGLQESTYPKRGAVVEQGRPLAVKWGLLGSDEVSVCRPGSSSGYSTI